MIQIRRKKNVKKGIQFCLMVCGASGTGKFICGYLVYQRMASTGQLDNPLTIDSFNRPYYIRQHSLREEGSRAQGCR